MLAHTGQYEIYLIEVGILVQWIRMSQDLPSLLAFSMFGYVRYVLIYSMSAEN